MNYANVKHVIEVLGSADSKRFGGKTGGIYLQQIADELAEAIIFIDNYFKPKNIINYLEIGPASGGLTFIINQFFSPQSITLIDDNSHPLHCVRSSVLSKVNRIELIGDSHSDYIKGCLNELTTPDDYGNSKEFDFVVIDGDHSYDGVKQDLELIKWKFDNRGLIFLHDIGVSEDESIKVSQLRQEILDGKHNLKEVFSTFSKEHKPIGIGLYKNARVSPS